MKNYSRALFLPVMFVLITAIPALACDPCSLYSASRLQGHSAGAFTFALSEQYTDFERSGDVKDNSVRDGEFVRGFSTTQFSLAYDLSARAGVQIVLPLITRTVEQIDRYRSSTHSVSEMGDISLLASYALVDLREADWAFIVGSSAGVKFPSGDTGVLEDASDGADELLTESYVFKHHPIGSATEGRALAFGSGSYDYIFGLDLLTRYQRVLLLSNAQYTLRTEGDFDYEFADDILGSIGGGYYFLLEHEFAMAGLVMLSSENKSNDHRAGQLVPASAVSNLYLGPELLVSINEVIGAQVGVDFRITDQDAGVSVVPSTRVRASVSYRF